MAVSRIHITPIIFAVLATAALMLTALPARAQCEFEWKPGVGLVEEEDNRVGALAVYDGKLIAGGQFTFTAGGPVHHIAQWDGNRWSVLGDGLDGFVGYLTIYNGNLIAGGTFTYAGDVEVNYIAQWDGASWSDLDTGMDNRLYGLAVYDGKLIAAGLFRWAGDVQANRVAQWDGASWSALGTGIGMVSGSNMTNLKAGPLAVYNGNLIVAGYFDRAGDEYAYCIAQWDGACWSPFSSPLGEEDIWDIWGLLSLTVYDNKLIVGGSFKPPGAVPWECIAQWDGSSWASLGDGVDYGKVYDMTVYNGKLIATGYGVLAGGALYTNYVAQWDGTSWSALGGKLNNIAGALTIYEDHLIVGGRFTTVGGEPSPYWARWGSDNQPPTAVAGEDQAIHAGQMVYPDGGNSYDDNTASLDLGYAWTLTVAPEGSTATLAGAETANPSFLTDLLGTYELSLVVTDECDVSSAPDTVTISSENVAPTANAGADVGTYVGEVVQLEGTGSMDPEHDPLSYAWEIVARPEGSSAGLDDVASPAPILTPDLPGQYTVQLVVNDGFEDSAPDEVVISVVTPEEFAETTIMEGLNLVVELPPASVTTAGNQTALGNFHTQAIVALQSGDVAKAIDKLNKAISRTDGCVLRGAPDGNGPGRDWITDCAGQEVVYWLLMDALDAISP